MVALPGTMRLQWSVLQDMHHSYVYPLFPDVSLLFGEVGVLDDVFNCADGIAGEAFDQDCQEFCESLLVLLHKVLSLLWQVRAGDVCSAPQIEHSLLRQGGLLRPIG